MDKENIEEILRSGSQDDRSDLLISMTREHKAIIDAAFASKEQGEYEHAARYFQKAIDQFGETGETVGMLAMILLVNLKRPQDSIPYARRAAELMPESEFASIGLVHCLLALNLQDEIEPEIRRYVAIGETFELYEVLWEENGLTKADFI
ncbi:MAG: hypothetical protein AAFR61_11435 [Bacteroidota bacterium]